MWIYNQSNGATSRLGVLAGFGYSGALGYVNDPEAERLIGLGPIPRGSYQIGSPVDLQNLGPHVMSLTPDADTDTFGRGGFFIHGDSVEFAGQERASHGCIILSRAIRNQISESGDTLLEVV